MFIGIVQGIQYPLSAKFTSTIQPLLPDLLQDDPSKQTKFVSFIWYLCAELM